MGLFKRVITYWAETGVFYRKVAEAAAWAAIQPILVQAYVSIDRFL